MIKQILQGLAEIHKKGIIHSDIKPENIMGTKDYQAILIDFGLSCFIRNSICPRRGSPLYFAPEAFTQNYFTKKSDIWSLGATLYTILVGELYPTVNNVKELKKTLSNPNLRWNVNTPNKVVNSLIKSMLTYDVNNRPSAKKLLINYF